MFKFEELRVYQEAINFTDSVYLLSSKFPREELFGLTNQLRRASVSIALTIAEGSSRSKKEFRHYLDMARGSAYECIATLTIVKNRAYMTEEEYNNFYNRCNILTKMINKLKLSLQ